MKKIALFSLCLGVALAWLVMFLRRVSIDNSSPFLAAEFWVVSLFSVVFGILLWDRVKKPEIKSYIQVLLILASVAPGIFLGFLWQGQMGYSQEVWLSERNLSEGTRLFPLSEAFLGHDRTCAQKKRSLGTSVKKRYQFYRHGKALVERQYVNS